MITVKNQTVYKKFLLIRTDRIGDAVTILPAVNVLRKNFPNAHIAIFCRDYTADIFKNNPQIDEIIIKTTFWKDLRNIRDKKFDVAIIFFLNTYCAWLTFLACIPIRIGPVSKIWAFLLSKRVYQRRSQDLKHEADYNVELLKFLNINISPAEGKIYMPPADNIKAQNYLKEMFNIDSKNKFIIIHPGSGGSALNWPADNFALLIKEIMTAYPALKVLLTGGSSEQKTLNYIASKVAPFQPFILKENLALTDFISIINECVIFISNSTGPLHIAAALGKRTVSFYPNVKGCLPKRWSPYGQGHIVLVAGNGKPTLRKECPDDFMSDITPQKAFDAFERQLENDFELIN
ncbi:MAG: glycosyltransferase family 9 protein [Elusimicrobiota bacterium]|jgi:ADP-heptose:LPS heptosyltransferase|nr:glycosyltransferase family 9 protein [Elusimicrobiota bacterium]